VELPKGTQCELRLFPVSDDHLASRKLSSGWLEVVPVRQAYVDLISIGTWEAKYAALALS